MLPKQRRIARSLFKDLFGGKRYHSSHLILYITHTGNEKVLSKFSFSVSKKVSKSAVDRNKLRRQGYAVISRHIGSIQSGYLCFFSFKKKPSSKSFAIIEGEVLDLLRNSRVIR